MQDGAAEEAAVPRGDGLLAALSVATNATSAATEAATPRDPGPEPTGQEGQRDLGSLAALAATLASLAFVLLNSAYLAFYDSVGVRPEDVGLDRLALLARTSGLVLAIMIITGAVGLIIVILALWLKRLRLPLILDVNVSIWPMVKVLWTSSVAPAWRRLRRLVLLIASCAALLLISILTAIATIAADRAAERVEDGLPVAPLRSGPLLFIDIDADPARAEWLDDPEKRPSLLDDPWLLYLGQSKEVAVFVACGQTLILPADKVVSIVLTTADPADAARDATGDERQDKCERLAG